MATCRVARRVPARHADIVTCLARGAGPALVLDEPRARLRPGGPAEPCRLPAAEERVSARCDTPAWWWRMSGVKASRAASGMVAALMLAASLSIFVDAVAASATVVRSAAPIASVTRHGGLCVTGRECRLTLQIDDTTIAGDGYASRPLKASDRIALLRAIGTLDAKCLRA